MQREDGGQEGEALVQQVEEGAREAGQQGRDEAQEEEESDPSLHLRDA